MYTRLGKKKKKRKKGKKKDALVGETLPGVPIGIQRS